MKPLKYYIHSKNNDIKEYTIQLLIYLARKNGDEIVSSPSLADYILVSICDITEAKEIVNAKQYGKPVITGGLISEIPILNELSDYVWHGEIYPFFKMMREYDSIEEIPYITTKKKRTLKINTDIEWRANPIVRVGSKSAYYYTAKGCPVRCKYCYIGHIRPYIKCPESIYRSTEKAICRNKLRMMPIAAYNPYEPHSKRGVTEVLMSEYIKPSVNVSSTMIRFGYEFVDPFLSKALAKGVTIEQFNLALLKTKATKTKSIVYFIAGLESTNDIINKLSIDVDFAVTPVVTLNWTYFSPQAYTPMYDFNVSNRVSIDTKAIFRELNAKNKRIRVNPLAPITKSTIRTFMERTQSTEEFIELSRLLNKYAKINNFELLNKYNHLVGTSTLEEVLDRRRTTTHEFKPYWEA